MKFEYEAFLELDHADLSYTFQFSQTYNPFESKLCLFLSYCFYSQNLVETTEYTSMERIKGTRNKNLKNSHSANQISPIQFLFSLDVYPFGSFFQTKQFQRQISIPLAHGLRGSTEHQNTMRRNLIRSELVVEGTEVLVLEEITEVEVSLLAEVSKLDGDLDGLVRSVHETNGPLLVGELTDPDVAGSALLSESVALDTERILVDSNDFLVQKDLLRPVINVSEIVRHVERSSNDGPDTHLSLRLVLVETVLHTDEEHIGIVPVAGTSVLSPNGMVTPGINDVEDGAPLGIDITVVSPEVAVVGKELVVGVVVLTASVSGPGAGVEDGSASLVEEVSHTGVGIRVVQDLGVATVHLESIDAPLSEGLGILDEVTLRTDVATAGVSTVVVVDTEEEALAVDVVGEPLDTVGETNGIGSHDAVLVSLLGGPAVINVDTLMDRGGREGGTYVVTGLEIAVLSKTIGHVDEEVLVDAGGGVGLAVDLAVELLPSEPALGRHIIEEEDVRTMGGVRAKPLSRAKTAATKRTQRKAFILIS